MVNTVRSFEMPEVWHQIIEFPAYSISNWGHVVNDRTGFHIKPTKSTRGAAIVGLMKSGIQHKRQLALLVATAFVSRTDEGFDTPINLDGDRMNNRADNLMWRPLWFARKYNRQFSDGHVTFDSPVEDIATGEVYENSMHASMMNGILDVEIYLAMCNNTYVWPTGQIFREAR